MRSILALAAVAAMAGCATEPASQAAAGGNTTVASASQAQQQPQQVCTKEFPMGSQIPRTVCRDPRTDAEIAADQDAMRRAVRPAQNMPVGH